MKKLYAMITTDCNLHCPHCNIPDDDHWNESRFMDKLQNFEGNIVFFGGEPTLYRDRFYMVVDNVFESNKSTGFSITTNLVDVDETLLEYLKLIHHVATSWNKSRFNPSQYTQWKENLHRIDDAGIAWNILVTLTPDLIDEDPIEFIDTVYSWGKFTNTNGIMFEHVVFDDADKAYYQKADEWMCGVHRNWNLMMPVSTFYDLKWWFDCTNTYTLMPDGSMRDCCPTGLDTCKKVPKECLVCDHTGECRPCVLQKGCSYPHNLYKLIKEDYERYERYSQK